jgi:HTH-type transcriptional regulator/antitoxin MqsA
MICASCGADELRPGVRDYKQTYKGRINIIKDVHADWCDSCGEAELDAGDGPEGKEADRVSDEMGAFIDKVKAEMTDAEFIQTVRENLGLKKKEAAVLFGGGHNGFTRYESGKTVPPVALVLLFRLLDKHPELLDEVFYKDDVPK